MDNLKRRPSKPSSSSSSIDNMENDPGSNNINSKLRNIVYKTTTTMIQLSPFFLAALFLTINSATSFANKKDDVWATPLVLICIILYLLVVDSFNPKNISPTNVLYIASLVWIVWLIRREVFLHHGEPWLGIAVFLLRIIILTIVLVTTFFDFIWYRKKIWMIVIPQLYAILYFIPYAADGNSGSEDFNINVLSPIVKTTLFLALVKPLEIYWDNYLDIPEEKRKKNKSTGDRLKRYDHSSASRRMFIQYSSVFSTPWYISIIITLIQYVISSKIEEQKKKLKDERNDNDDSEEPSLV